jgi:hypothetical protein
LIPYATRQLDGRRFYKALDQTIDRRSDGHAADNDRSHDRLHAKKLQ